MAWKSSCSVTPTATPTHRGFRVITFPDDQKPAVQMPRVSGSALLRMVRFFNFSRWHAAEGSTVSAGELGGEEAALVTTVCAGARLRSCARFPWLTPAFFANCAAAVFLVAERASVCFWARSSSALIWLCAFLYMGEA